jgi:hypothetical protein
MTMSRWRFGNADHTLVVRDDGVAFSWPLDNSENSVLGHVNPANIPGTSRVVEQWRLDGGPAATAPYKPPTKPVADDHDRRRRRDDAAAVPRRLR